MNRMKNRIPYSVPEGYFDCLEENLLRIPEGRNGKISPHWKYYALSAVCAAAMVLFLFFSWSGGETVVEDFSYDQYLMSDLIPHTDPYLVYSVNSEDNSTMTEQDIEDFLISCAVNINE